MMMKLMPNGTVARSVVY